MASVTDTLTTLLVLSGAASYVAGMNQAATAAMGLARATNINTGEMTAAGEKALTFSQQLGAVTAAVAAIKITVDLASDAFRTFAEEQDQLFRTSQVFRNLGQNMPVERLEEMSNQLSRATGLSRSELEGAAGLVARIGARSEQIPGLLLSMADAARGTGHSVTEVAKAFELGGEGTVRRLKEMGIEIQDTGSKLGNLFQIQRAGGQLFRGDAAAFLNTPQGALDSLTRSVTQFMSALGQELGPEITLFLRGLTRAFDWLTDHIHQVVAVVRFALGPIAWISGLIGASHPELQNPAAQFGKNQPATEGTAREIADNTRRAADAVEQNVTGGGGTVVREAFAWSQARHAMII